MMCSRMTYSTYYLISTLMFSMLINSHTTSSNNTIIDDLRKQIHDQQPMIEEMCTQMSKLQQIIHTLTIPHIATHVVMNGTNHTNHIQTAQTNNIDF